MYKLIDDSVLKTTKAKEFCNKTIKSKTGYYNHKSVEKPATYQCDICQKVFSRKWSLTRHKQTHSNLKKYVCGTCGKRFNRKDYLSHHLAVHNDERPYCCTKCDKTFRTASGLTTHQATHCVGLSHKCPICEKWYKTKDYLNKHMIYHKEAKCACGICGKKFYYSHRLKSHKCKN